MNVFILTGIKKSSCFQKDFERLVKEEMLTVAKRSPTDFTGMAVDVKEKLDEKLRIVVREDAMRVITEMENILKNENQWSALGGKQAELLKILENVPEYMANHYVEQSDGTCQPGELIPLSIYEGENKELIDKAMKVYKKYATKISRIADISEGIDASFINTLNEFFSEYKSSTDYMTRLVNRLIRYNVDDKSDFKESDTTRVLILKQFIKQFGYDCVEEINCPELKTVIDERYNGNIKDIDDSVFTLLDDAKSETEDDDNTRNVYDDKYINSITKLLDTIIVKSPLIYITEDICKQIREIINHNILSDKVLAGGKILLSDCFSKPYFEVRMTDFVNYDDIKDIDKLDALNSQLHQRYQNGYLLYTDFSYFYRLYVLMTKYSKQILITKGKNYEKKLRKIYKNAIISQEDPTDKEISLDMIFDVKKIEYQEIQPKNHKLVEYLEKNLFSLKTAKRRSNLIQRGKSLKKEYSYKVGQFFEKRENEQIGKPIKDYTAYTPLFRLSTVISEYSKIIPCTSESIKLLSGALPDISFLEPSEPKYLSDYIDKSIENTIKSLTEDQIVGTDKAIREFLSIAEKNIKDKSEYASKIRKKVENRYNNKSKIGNGTDFIANKRVLYSLKKQKVYEYKLLKIADKLANSKFSYQNKTREYLYIFAIAFDIRKVEGGKADRIVDIEKNLFRDYYADNIVNHMPNVVGLGDSSDIVIDGYGVNYKNFAEVIFLWSLEQEGMTAKKRLQEAYEIIEYCKNNGKTEEEFFKDHSNPKTFDTKTEIYCKDYSIIKELTGSQLKEYVKENYPCNPINGIVQINDKQRTAAEIICEQEKIVNKLLKRAEKKLSGEITDDYLLEKFSDDSTLKHFFGEYEYLTSHRCKNCPKSSTKVFPECDKYFDDCRSYYDEYVKEYYEDNSDKSFEYYFRLKKESFKSVKAHFEQSFSGVNELCDDSQESLKLVLNVIKKRLEANFEEGKAKIHFNSVSRSTIIALCFYEYMLINWIIRKDSERDAIIGAFEKIYDSFCNGGVFLIAEEDDEGNIKFESIAYKGANERLSSAGYQPINSKNVFDIYLIYIIYRDNLLPIYTSQEDALFDFYNEKKKIYEELNERRDDISITR